ncbi:MAG: diguanylate cyclase [Oscillospiraceae bacterium]|nr:diguanylate cyclase [Oscillospiraceae bacterium]MDD4413367.1 diguanylate cyclase [Oscillospiraceae bacterium]
MADAIYKVVYIEMNLFAFVVLMVILLSNRRHANGYAFEQKIFVSLLVLTAFQLVVNTALFVMDGMPGAVMKELIYITEIISYVFTPPAFILWVLYVRFQVYKDEKKALKMLIPISIPVVINAVLAIVSRFNGLLYSFDENNNYHRGPLFWVYTLMCVSYLLITEVYIFVMQKKITKKHFIPLLLFAVPPLLGGVLQVLFYGIQLVWVSTTISVLIISLNIQNDQLYIDHLTGLSNRRQLDYFLQNIIKKGDRSKLIAGIMLDLDYFKHINDVWGHMSGDKTLISAGEILCKSFDKDALICRYGGDEFVVIFQIDNKQELNDAVNRVKLNTSLFNNQSELQYRIEFSMGYDIYDYDSECSAQQFLSHIDKLMYNTKTARKARKDLEA